MKKYFVLNDLNIILVLTLTTRDISRPVFSNPYVYARVERK